MKHLSLAHLRSAIRRLRSEQQGTVAVIFSVAMVPVVMLFGLALSYSEGSQKRVDYQRLADAAALAGSTASATDADEARQNRAANWFKHQARAANLPYSSVDVTVSNGNVVVTAEAEFKPSFAPMFGNSMTIRVSSSAQLATTKIRRALDVVFCIDATGSMQNTINSVKSHAGSFANDLNNALTSRGLEQFDYTRIRAVFYRDFYYDDGQWAYYYGYGWYQNPIPMSASSFYEMPSQNSSLTSFLGTQNANGGGDLPESGYECIHEAMTSSWKKVGDSIPGSSNKIDAVYPVVVLWTDADARTIPDSYAQNKPLYPAAMPRSQSTYLAKWNNASVIDQSNRMLAIFGPCGNSSWSLARSMMGYMCAGSLSDGNNNMVNKIADAMVVRYKNLNARLTK